MAVSHVKSNAIGDFTGTVTVFNSVGGTATVAATDLVRPSDWNSAHNHYYTLTGNTTGNSTASGTNVIFAGSGGISIGGSTGTIVISAPNQTISSFAPFELPGLASTTAGAGIGTSGIVSFWPMTIDDYVAAAELNLMASVSFITTGTSSGQQTNGYRFGMYSRGTGANSTTMGTFTSASFSFGVTYNNSNITINYPGSTGSNGYTTSTTSSAGINLTSLFSGNKVIQVPIGSTLTPGVYWLGMMATNSTSSNNCGFSLSWIGASQSQTALAPLNAHTSNYTTGTGFAAAGGSGGPWGFGHGSWTSAGNVVVPDSVAYSAMSAGVVMIPYMKFWST